MEPVTVSERLECAIHESQSFVVLSLHVPEVRE
jgi:hypothetical protein